MTGPAPDRRTPLDGLVAARFPLDPGPPIDPCALAGARGTLFRTGDRVRVGLGSAARIALPHGLDSETDLRAATAVLAAIPCDDHCHPAGGAVTAFGALPFERSSPATLVVPEVTYGTDAGHAWVSLVVPAGGALPSSPTGLRAWLAAAQTEGGHAENRLAALQVVPLASDASFVAMVSDALASIGRGDLQKVVLARQADVTAPDRIDIPALLRRWHSLEPNCTLFSVPTPHGQFVGASPELLVERSGAVVVSRPLAGTAERLAGTGARALPEALLESRKDAVEHRLVVDAVAAVLGPLCSDLEVPSQPELVHLHNIIHLGTSVRGTLASDATGRVPDALELVGALHPTPAVGGVPTRPALDAIRRLEGTTRGHYAGPVGYVDARGDGRWMVGIRAMTINDRTARLSAGVGIVPGSEPESERVETDLKLTAVLDALAPSRHDDPWPTRDGVPDRSGAEAGSVAKSVAG
jgi:menaquinone-specific isochorismate synthase